MSEISNRQVDGLIQGTGEYADTALVEIALFGKKL